MQTSVLLPPTSKDGYRSNSVAFVQYFCVMHKLHPTHVSLLQHKCLDCRQETCLSLYAYTSISFARAYIHTLLHMTNISLWLFRYYTDVNILGTCLTTFISSLQHCPTVHLNLYRLRSYKDRSTELSLNSACIGSYPCVRCCMQSSFA